MSTYNDHVNAQHLSSSSHIQFKHSSKRNGGVYYQTDITKPQHADILEVSHVRAHKILEKIFPDMSMQQRRRVPQECKYIWQYFYYYTVASCHPNTLCLEPCSDKFLTVIETNESYMRHLVLFVMHYEHNIIHKRKTLMNDIIMNLLQQNAMVPPSSSGGMITMHTISQMPSFPKSVMIGDDDMKTVISYLWDKNAQLLPEHLIQIEK